MKKSLLGRPLFILLSFAVFFFTFIFGSGYANASAPPDSGGVGVGSVSPASGSGTRYSGSTNYLSGTSITPYYDIGNNNGDYTYADMETRVYVKDNSNVAVTIHNGFTDCYQASGGGVVGPDYTENGIAPIVTYELKDSTGLIATVTAQGGGCGTISFPVKSTNNLIGITPTKNADGYLLVIASISSLSSGQGENSYQLDASSFGSGTSDGIVGSGSTTFGLGYRDGNLANGNYWAAWTSFALPIDCSDITNDNVKPNQTIRYLDTDATKHPEWNSNMIFELQEQTINPTTQALGSWNTVASAAQPGMAENGGLNFDARSNARYRLVLINVGVRNTIRISIPTTLSTLYSKLSERKTIPECTTTPPPITPPKGATDNASCSATMNPANPQDPKSTVKIAVTMKNTGSSTWNTAYYLKRSKNGGAFSNMTASGTVSNPGTLKYTDTVTSPAADNTDTYVYKMFGPGGGFGVSCTKAVQSKALVTGTNSCTARAVNSRTVLPVWDGKAATKDASTAHIKVTVHNGGYNPYFPGGASGFYVRQIAFNNAAPIEDSPVGGQRPLSRNVYPTQTDQNIVPFDPGPRRTPTKITFWYALFTGPDITDSRVGTFQCSATIEWKAGPVPKPGTTPPSSSGHLDVGCYETKVADVFVPATRTVGTSKKLITKVPARIEVWENGAKIYETWIAGGVPNGTSAADTRTSNGYSTFGFGTMWPNRDYDLKLFLEGSGSPAQNSLTYGDNGVAGSYAPAIEFDSQSTPGGCLTAECTEGADGDVEPGQNVAIKGGIKFFNHTQQEYDADNPGGYSIRVDTDGGLGSPPGAPVSTNGDKIQAGNGSSTVHFEFAVTANYRGSYNWTLLFQGEPLSLGQDIPCPGATITPQTRPFLQVWGGDINTGGGFMKDDGKCPVSYPGYVSPSSAPGNDRNYGGIKAYGVEDNVNGSYGSLADFGVLSLGIIAYDPTAKINFDGNPKFSNIRTSSSTGGELNSTSPDYCIPNYYGEGTRKDPAPQKLAAGDRKLSDLVGSPTGQYQIDGDVNLEGGTVAAGQKITLYIKGNITIKTPDIKYIDDWDPNDPESAPSFTIVALGNINIDQDVERIDGIYIAQPTDPGLNGVFNDCADNAGNQVCNKIFVSNGAVIARLIKPLRSIGTLSPDANPNFSPAPGHNGAEIFNYIPSMLMSGPNFSPIHNNREGLFNLPPVF